MGFVPDQIRTTTRRPRDVFREGKTNAAIAEMVIDSVEYSFEAGTVRHHEIEVEAKGPGLVEDIQEVSSCLLDWMPGSLRVWHFGKRATGRVVASLLEERGPTGLVSASGDLLPGAYDQILTRLE